MNNPYAGQDGYDRAWSDGFEYGRNHPQEEYPTAPAAFAPYDLDAQMLSYMQQVWLEGHLAGRSAGVHPDPGHNEHDGHNALGTATHVAEAVILGRSVLHAHWVSAVIEAFLMVMIPSGAPKIEQEQGDLNQWFANACQSGGWSEFFLAATFSSTESVPPWYGYAYAQYEPAFAEAAAHLKQHPDTHVEVLHYKCDSPNELEVLEVGYR